MVSVATTARGQASGFEVCSISELCAQLCQLRQTWNAICVKLQEVLAVRVNLHVDRLLHLTMHLAFDLSQDLGRHKALWDFTESHLEVFITAAVVDSIGCDLICVCSGSCSFVSSLCCSQGFGESNSGSHAECCLKQGFHLWLHTSNHDWCLGLQCHGIETSTDLVEVFLPAQHLLC